MSQEVGDRRTVRGIEGNRTRVTVDQRSIGDWRHGPGFHNLLKGDPGGLLSSGDRHRTVGPREDLIARLKQTATFCICVALGYGSHGGMDGRQVGRVQSPRQIERSPNTKVLRGKSPGGQVPPASLKGLQLVAHGHHLRPPWFDQLHFSQGPWS